MNPTAAKFLGTFLIVLALVAAAIGLAQTRRVQLLHRATAVVQLERDETDLPGFKTGMPAGADMDYILKTEAELIPSEFILNPVIEKLDLNSIWGKRYNDRQKFKTTESREILKKCFSVMPVTGAARIQIVVTREAEEETLKIVNAVAQSYCDYRVDRRRKIAENGLAAIAEPFKSAEAKVLAAQKELEAAQGLLPPDLHTNPTQLSNNGSSALRDAQSSHNQARIQSLSLENQLQSAVRSTSPDTNFIAKTKAEITKVQAALVASSEAITAESRRVEALRAYWVAREKLESAGKMFAPFKQKSSEIQASGSSSNKPPANIVERTEKSEEVESRDASSGNLLFGIAGALALLGAGIFLTHRHPVAIENQKVA